MNARPVAASVLQGLAAHQRIVEEAFTILHEGKPLPANAPLPSLRAELARYGDEEREFGKAGHAAFGLWELWAAQGHELGQLINGGLRLMNGDVIVTGFDAEATETLSRSIDEVSDVHLDELFFSPELRAFARYTDVARDDDYADEEVEMFRAEINGARALLRRCRDARLGLLLWVG